MDSHIDRLIAACGLAHFSYRQWPAPEIVVVPRVVEAAPEPEPDIPPAVAEPPAPVAAEAPPVLAAAPIPAAIYVPAPVSAPVAVPRAAPVAPLVGLPPPPPIVAPPASPPPLRLPEPETVAMARAVAPRQPAPSGRPPVSLPPPDRDEGPIIAFRDADRRLPERRRTPRLPPVHIPVEDAPPRAAPAARSRRFALLDEMRPDDASSRRPRDS